MTVETILTPEAIAVIGIFLAVAARSFMPYLRKTVKDGKKLVWEHKYSAILIASAVITLLVFPQFQIPTDGVKIFVAAFVFGWGMNSLAIEGMEWLRKPKSEDAV
ncbi:MAG: hypothetical protein ACE5IF_01935 [Candidatus Bathyarchaeia archaeon]